MDRIENGKTEGAGEGKGRTDGRKSEDEGRFTRGRGRVRLATFADFDAIMEINDNIYEGVDQMPAMFYIFMHSKNFVIYVYEEDGKLMGLINFQFHPGTDDLVTVHSSRVRPSIQGQGLLRFEISPFRKALLKDHPKVKRRIVLTYFKPKIPNFHESSTLYRWNFITYRLSNRQLLERLPKLRDYTNPRTRPTRLSYSAGCEWLNRTDQLVKFLSSYAKDHIVAGAKWVPVKVDVTELRQLFTYTKMFVSFGDKTVILPADDDKVFFGEGNEIAGFSCSSILQCKYGVNFEISFYGDNENDLLSHVYSHVLHYVSVTQDDVRIACIVHFPLTIDVNSVRERLREGLGESYQSKYFNASQAVQYVHPIDILPSKI